MLRSVLVLALLLAPLPALAQQAAVPTDTTTAKCYLGGKTFSAGATIRASAQVNVCGADGNWAATDKVAAGCFFADALYSTGATAAVAGSKTTVETCQPDGTWATAPAPVN
jgi:hypothetical protein